MTSRRNPVLAKLAHAPGMLSYRDARYLLIRPETLAVLQHTVEAALGAGAGECSRPAAAPVAVAPSTSSGGRLASVSSGCSRWAARSGGGTSRSRR